MSSANYDLSLSFPDLESAFTMRFGNPRTTGPLPKLRHRLGYHVPDSYYEAMVAKLVTAETTWLEVGCGRRLFPSNPALANALAKKCRLLVGIDPDDTITENSLVS